MKNNPQTSSTNDPEAAVGSAAIRSDIRRTRREVDDTIDRISNRFQGRHLADEALHYFRENSRDVQETISRMAHRTSESVGSALHSTVEGVKRHPVPLILAGAGVAWYLYERRRAQQADDWESANFYDDREQAYYASPGTAYEPSYEGESADGGSLGQSAKAKAHNVADAWRKNTGIAREKAEGMSDKLKERGSEMRERAQEFSERVRTRASDSYRRGRDRAVDTIEQRPLESALACLTIGILAGLALPTSRKVSRLTRPAAERLRERGRDLVERGKHVGQAAVAAAKEETEHQGLTPAGLKEKAGHVADHAKKEAQATARREGLTPDDKNGDEAHSGSEAHAGATHTDRKN